MDSLFDDDQDAVGSEIEAYCPGSRCKADMTHIIVSMYEDEVRRVQCSTCGDIHAYRRPRGDPAEAAEASSSRPRMTKKPTWDVAMAQVTEQELSACRPYSVRDTYEPLDVVSHPKFGVGFVTELLPDNKCEITFKDERRVLIHNRSDLATQMPDISAEPVPREVKKKRRRKKPQSELASRLLRERAKKGAKSKGFQEQAQAKREAAERAAEARRLIADGEVEPGMSPMQVVRELAEEKERARLAKEQAKEDARLKKEAEKEKARLKKEAEKEKARLKKEREREKVRKQKERERERKVREREKAQLKKQREREKAQLKREREREKKELAREKIRLKKERERLRRTGGKKSIPSIRRTGGKKSIPSSGKKTKKSTSAKKKSAAKKRSPAKKTRKKSRK